MNKQQQQQKQTQTKTTTTKEIKNGGEEGRGNGISFSQTRSRHMGKNCMQHNIFGFNHMREA